MKRLRAHEVRLARKELGLTMSQLADALGLDNAKGYARKTISDWEAGRRVVPGPVTLAVTHLLEKHRAA